VTAPEPLALDAMAMLRAASQKHSIHLSVLVAETALWVNPKVHEILIAENGFGTFFPKVRRFRAGMGELRAQVKDGERLDDNSYANHALKRALGRSHGKLVGFEVCHIWPQSCYDARYHTVLANLVLLPRALAGLTDHDPAIQAALQFRAFKLYRWCPSDVPEPREPDFYPTNWREPEPFTKEVERSLAARRPSHLVIQSDEPADNER